MFIAFVAEHVAVKDFFTGGAKYFLKSRMYISTEFWCCNHYLGRHFIMSPATRIPSTDFKNWHTKTSASSETKPSLDAFWRVFVTQDVALRYHWVPALLSRWSSLKTKNDKKKTNVSSYPHLSFSHSTKGGWSWKSDDYKLGDHNGKKVQVL